MPTPQKETLVSDMAEELKNAQGVILTDYRGLSVAQVTELRKKLRESDTHFAIVKNTLFMRATDGIIAPDPKLAETLNGPTAVGFANKDAIESAKAIIEYIVTHRGTPLKIKGAVVDGRFYDAKQVDALSKIPPRTELIAQMLGSFNAPITGLVGTLNGIISNFVYTLQAIQDQKQESAG